LSGDRSALLDAFGVVLFSFPPGDITPRDFATRLAAPEDPAMVFFPSSPSSAAASRVASAERAARGPPPRPPATRGFRVVVAVGPPALGALFRTRELILATARRAVSAANDERWKR
jgi:hypothetical protein